MKPRMKSTVTKELQAALIGQLREGFATLKAAEKAFGEKAEPPKYIITEDIRERWTDFLITLGELDEIGEKLEERFGQNASETHDLLVQKFKEYWCDETAKGNVTLFLPAWKQYEVIDEPTKGETSEETQ